MRGTEWNGVLFVACVCVCVCMPVVCLRGGPLCSASIVQAPQHWVHLTSAAVVQGRVRHRVWAGHGWGPCVHRQARRGRRTAVQSQRSFRSVHDPGAYSCCLHCSGAAEEHACRALPLFPPSCNSALPCPPLFPPPPRSLQQLTSGSPFVTYTQSGGVTRLSFCRPLTAPGLNPVHVPGLTTTLFAFGHDNGFGQHPSHQRQVGCWHGGIRVGRARWRGAGWCPYTCAGWSLQVFTVDFSAGTASAHVKGWTNVQLAHGSLMFLAWGVLLPLGMFIARFGRLGHPHVSRWSMECDWRGGRREWWQGGGVGGEEDGWGDG
jgi:hypothetical protein